MKIIITLAAALLIGISSAQAGNKSSNTIVDIAAKAGSFNTLVAAVKAAGLADTLSSKGPFTVFAPTDEAFAKLPKGTVESLLKPENKDKLIAILTYHVVGAKVMSSDVKSGKVATVNGQKLSIKAGKKGVRVDKAKVVKVDIEASNGVIHVIDTVVLPK
ncbi:MAG: fasciclin domain-containing protein [Limisphaerales bacterium]